MSEPGADSRRDAEAAFAAASLGPPQCVDLCPICRGADVLRATGSPDLRDGWQSVQREALVTMRALIDHYLERLDDAEAEAPGPRVVDIPID